MSPEDDLPIYSQTVPLNTNWQKETQQPKLIDPIWKTNGQTNTQSQPIHQQQHQQQQNSNNKNQNQQQIINGINNKDKDNKHRWSPLPQQDEQKLSQTINLANNNDWINWPSENNKYMNKTNINENDDDWKDITDIDDNGVHNKSLGNNNGSLLNGNGHSDKLAEDDPLTGQLRHPAELDDGGDESNCGIGSFQPKWAKKFASTHAFMVVFLLAWILQGMYYTYFVSVITTIEKLFKIKSKITGLLMSATEIGQISTSLFLTYYAGRGHRPRWIACGMILFAIASFGCTLPHFIYGEDLLRAHNLFNSAGHNITDTNDGETNLCHISSDINHTNLYSSDQTCENQILIDNQKTHSQITKIVLVIFSISLLGVGVGQTAVSTLGIPYIDDNVASRESPIYIAITIGVRILGPAGGFILGSLCTRVYVNITENPGIGPTNPEWVGAWWLGLVLVSSLMAITSLAMFTFPKTLKGNRIPPPIKLRAIQEQKKIKEEEPKTPQLKDFPKTIKRQLSNDILMFRTASSVLHLLPVAGLYTFLPKYMESQFRLTAHDANLITGIGGILVMGVGIVISGVVILKFSPTARSVAAWIAFSAIFYSCGMVILMFIGCPMDDFKGLKPFNEPPLQKFEAVCTTNCECDTNKFSPICGSDGMIYFSSCHAGCTNSTKTNGRIEFNECSCIAPLEPHQKDQPHAVGGYCDGNCKNFIYFICLFSFFVFMHSTSEVGSMLLIMRCTDPKDKAMAMGVIQFAIGLFGNVPCPIIYGSVVDSACLVWDTICGKQGACALYDVDVFRHFFLGTTAAIMLCAFVMDLVVWHKAHRIDIDPESTSEIDYEKSANVPDTSSV